MARLLMEKDMDMELFCTLTIGFIKDNGNVTTKMEWDFNCFKMDAFIKVLMLMGSLKGWESISGLMANFIKDNGSAASNMDLECGMEPKVTTMSDNGNLERLMAMEYMYGSMEIDMKANLNNV